MDKPPTRFTVKNLERPTRLDRVISEQVPELGRRAIQTLVTSRKVKVGERVVWLCSWQVKNGDRIEIRAELESRKTPPKKHFDDAWVVAQESEFLVVDKPQGVLSHGTRADNEGDLLTLAIARFGPLFLFHRLDRDTSGLVLLTRNGPINRYLDTAFKEGSVHKEYWAAVPDSENIAASGVIKARLAPHPKRKSLMMVAERGGQTAVTNYEVLGRAEGVALLRLMPETGRTHQLRVHCAHLGGPILGDRLYGPPKPAAPRLLLHAHRLTLPEQDGYPERRFETPLPPDFVNALPETLRDIARKG